MNQTNANEQFTVISARKTGLKHIHTFRPCQDSVSVDVYSSYAIIAVADGHGHSMHYLSETGSRLACESAVEILGTLAANGSLADHTEAFQRRLIGKKIYHRWTEKVLCDFSTRCSPVSESSKEYVYSLYGTTLLCAAAIKNGIYLAQIGDGAIIVQNKNGVLSRPLRETRVSEYPDSLCSEDAGMLFRTVWIPADDYRSVFLCTDGVVNDFEDDKSFMMFVRGTLNSDNYIIPEKSIDDASAVALWTIK